LSRFRPGLGGSNVRKLFETFSPFPASLWKVIRLLKNIIKEGKMSEEKEVGKITHYFGKIEVGIVELSDALSVGDKIHIKGHTSDFEQLVESMEIEHKQIEKATKGDCIGLKVIKKVHEGDRVYKIIE